MGPICGCKRESDDSKETNLAGKKANEDFQDKQRLFERKFQEKLSLIGEVYTNTLEDIIPTHIKVIRDEVPLHSIKEIDSDNIHYKEEIKLKNDVIYKGGWNDLIQMEGRGLMILVNDQVLLEGCWKEGNFVFGRIYFKDGSYYEGEISGKLLNGQGKFVNKNKEQYEGSFVNGFREGQGCYHYEDGCIYIGEFKQDYQNGNGIMKWQNDTSYKGSFNKNTLEGNGELIMGNGCKYIGGFKSNWPDGEGEYTWPNGIVYTGQYERGKKEGKGIYQIKKTSIQGSWSNGILQGKATIGYNNKTYMTIWRNGRLIETKDFNSWGFEVDYFNSLPILNEEYEPSQLSHLIILDESRYQDYKPCQPFEKTFNTYFNTSRHSNQN